MPYRPLMIQGCTSDAGKSYLTAGLCRLFARRGIAPEKITKQRRVTFLPTQETVQGYEIHHGRTRVLDAASDVQPILESKLGYQHNNVMGAYVHGLFDDTHFRTWFLAKLGMQAEQRAWQKQVDQALDTLVDHLDIPRILSLGSSH